MSSIRMIIKKSDGSIVIPKSLYDDTDKDFKGIFEGNWNECNEHYGGNWEEYITKSPHIGKRTWMPPISLFGRTCLIVESDGFRIVDDEKFISMLNGKMFEVSTDGLTTIFKEV